MGGFHVALGAVSDHAQRVDQSHRRNAGHWANTGSSPQTLGFALEPTGSPGRLCALALVFLGLVATNSLGGSAATVGILAATFQRLLAVTSHHSLMDIALAAVALMAIVLGRLPVWTIALSCAAFAQVAEAPR